MTAINFDKPGAEGRLTWVLAVRRMGVVAVLCAASCAAWGQAPCQIKVIQRQQEVPSSMPGQVLSFELRPEPFQLEVSPAACSPTIATIPDVSIARAIGAKPLLYASRWAYLTVAGPEAADRLLWWAGRDVDATFLQPPKPDTFSGKQYLKLCEELTYCPNLYPPFSSGHPFVQSETGAKSVATFKRLDDKYTLADAQGKAFLNVIYTLWRALPSEYPMEDPIPLLFRPHFFFIIFKPDAG